MEPYITGHLPFDLQSALDKELDQSELLRWSCRPSVSRAVKKALPALFFGAFWLAFPIGFAAIMYKEIQRGDNVPIIAMVIVGVFFVIGLLILSAPFWAARTAKNTVYAVTNRRAIIAVKKGAEIDIQSYRPDELKDIDKRVRSDGSGDLIFERQVSYHHSRKHGTKERIKEIGFFGIPDIYKVEDMLQTLEQQ